MNNNGQIQLFSRMQMWYHKHILHFMFIFIITGMPLISTKMSWIAFLFGVPASVFTGIMSYQDIVVTGVQICRVIHRITAFLWILLSIPFVLRMLPAICKWGITPRRREGQSWKAYICEGISDTKRIYIDWKYPEHMGKYNLAQIVVAWAVIFICLAMIISGGVLWLSPYYFSGGLSSFMRLVHLAGFYAMLLFLLFHIYFAVHPVNRAGYVAMFSTGTDDVEHAKKKHPGLFVKKPE